jgi:hypothetical protein
MFAIKDRQGKGRTPAFARRVAALLGAGLIGSVTACSAVSTGTTSTPQAVPTASNGTQSAPAVTAASRSGVPWSQVGPDWTLAETTAGTTAEPGATTLYLVSPTGSTYPVYTWPASVPLPNLYAWSPSKTEVLLEETSSEGSLTGTYERLNLTSGQVVGTLSLPNATSLQYTEPDGEQFLVVQSTLNAAKTEQTETMSRLTLTGTGVQTLDTVTSNVNANESMTPVYSPDGTTIALNSLGGVAVLSNSASAGSGVRQLPVPGPGPNLRCAAVRWWNSSTVLASCSGSKGVQQLWLVPASGAAPTALTPLRQASGNGTSVDFGDLDAWQVTAGLYLQSAGACGVLELNKQLADGSITTITIPGVVSIDVLTSDGSRFLLDTRSCEGPGGGNSLMWYDPASGGTTLLLKSLRQVLPFPSEQDS